MAADPPDLRRARDLALLDTVDGFAREPFACAVWRVAREGRDPAAGSPSRGRWSTGDFDVLYTSLARDGALAEVHALLALQPVFPSKLRWFAHALRVEARETLKLADLPTLARLGVDVARYGDRDYGRTQEIADAAHFLGFDGLIAPSARFACANLTLFTGRLAPDQIEVVETQPEPIDWAAWRRQARK